MVKVTGTGSEGLMELVVELGGSRFLRLFGGGSGLTPDEFKRVAEQAEIDPSGLEWLGR